MKIFNNFVLFLSIILNFSVTFAMAQADFILKNIEIRRKIFQLLNPEKYDAVEIFLKKLPSEEKQLALDIILNTHCYFVEPTLKIEKQIEFLLKQGANPNWIQTSNPASHLDQGVGLCLSKVIKMIHNRDMLNISQDSESVCFLQEIIKALIKYKANPYIVDPQNHKTPIKYANDLISLCKGKEILEVSITLMKEYSPELNKKKVKSDEEMPIEFRDCVIMENSDNK